MNEDKRCCPILFHSEGPEAGDQEAYESNKQDITVALTKSYLLLLRKFISEKAKVSSLIEIVLYMNLELYSLKRQEQNLKNTIQLMKEAFFKHGDKDPLRVCVKAINFCYIESQGKLQDLARNKLKELEDELIVKLKYAIKEVVDGGDEYSLLVNSKRLYELQLSRSVPINNIYEDIVMVLRGFRNMEDEVLDQVVWDGLFMASPKIFEHRWGIRLTYGGSIMEDMLNKVRH